MKGPFLTKLTGELTGITLPHLFLLHAHTFFAKKSPDLLSLIFNLVYLVPLVLHFIKWEEVVMVKQTESSDRKPPIVSYSQIRTAHGKPTVLHLAYNRSSQGVSHFHHLAPVMLPPVPFLGTYRTRLVKRAGQDVQEDHEQKHCCEKLIRL